MAKAKLGRLTFGLCPLEQPISERRFYLVVALLASVGLALASYLSYLHFSHAQITFCTTGTGCDTVRESQYSTLLSVPVALLGAILFVAVIVVSTGPFKDRLKRTLLAVMATAGLAFSAYLTYLEAFTIHAYCYYCLATAAVVAAIFVLLHLRHPVVPGISWARLASIWALANIGTAQVLPILKPLLKDDEFSYEVQRVIQRIKKK